MANNDLKQPDYFAELCGKSLADSISPDEERELQTWLDQSADHQAFYKDFENVWQETDFVSPAHIPDVGGEWRRLSQSLGIARNEFRTNTLSGWFNRFLNPVSKPARQAIAAMALLLIVSVTAIVVLHTPVATINTIATARTEKEYILLPDQSKVWLNSESQLTYPKNFSETRKVHLSGEAYFVVVPNAKPFIVETQNARTRVLGTAFNVWSRNEQTRVTVKRGKVQLSRSETDSMKIQLNSNQTSRVFENKPAIAPDSINADHYIGWMDGRLVFLKTPLSEVMDELERFYGVDIEIADTSLSRETITASFENKTLDTVLQSLSYSTDSEYKIDNNHVEFQR